MKCIVFQQTEAASFGVVELDWLFGACEQSFSLELIDLGPGQKVPRK